jgi:hypothetical protein
MPLSNLKIKQKIEAGIFFVGKDEHAPISVEKLQFDTISLELHLGAILESGKSGLVVMRSLLIPLIKHSISPNMPRSTLNQGAWSQTEPIS